MKYFVLLALILATTFANLNKYNVDLQETTTSGISSGAYMAQQFSVAFSQTIKGAGVVAGGPFLCALGKMEEAVTACMSSPIAINLQHIEKEIVELEGENLIDNIENVQNQQIYLYSGEDDYIVRHGVMQKLDKQYEEIFKNKNTKTKFDVDSEHAWITNDYGNKCKHLGEPYINNCDYDLAGDMLTHFYGDLNEKVQAKHLNLIEFDQTPYSLEKHTLYKNGYVYVPTSCQQGKQCRIHVAFHGCKMTPSDIGTKFVEHAGLNEYAESNNIIVLYPQTVESFKNPSGCWDWWGYSNTDKHRYEYATKDGVQMKSIFQMLKDLSGEAPTAKEFLN